MPFEWNALGSCRDTCLGFLVLLGALTIGGPVQAERADRQKPMNVEADAMRYDDLKRVNVFTGRVVVTKGSIVIRAARLEVRQDAEGFQHGVGTAEPGARAYFKQKRDGVDETIEGEAEVVEYNGKADSVTFRRRAELRRYRGATLNDEVHGALIVFDNTTEVFTVDGNPAAAGGAGAGSLGGRVRVVLTPRPPASAASAPALPASAAAPLRLSGSATAPAPSAGGGAGAPAAASAATAASAAPARERR